MNKEKKNQVEALQELLQKNYDAEAGYKKVMNKVENESLKDWMQQRAARRSHFATEIDNELRKLNQEPAESGTFTGSAHRVWIDVKSAFSTDTDEAILEECIRGEKASVDEYKEQLTETRFDEQTRSVLHGQLESISASLSTVEQLEDIIG